MKNDIDNLPKMFVAAAAIVKDGKVLIAQCGPKSRFAGKWELPGGKVEAGETPAECIRREAEEELGVTVSVVEKLPAFEHDYGPESIGKVRLHFFLCRIAGGTPIAKVHSALHWISEEEIPHYDFLPADASMAKLACAKLKEYDPRSA